VKKALLLSFLSLCIVQFHMHAVAADTVRPSAGSILYSEDGHRLGPVYKVTDDGAAELIIDNKLVIIPATSLALLDGKLTTHLSKSEVYKLK